MTCKIALVYGCVGNVKWRHLTLRRCKKHHAVWFLLRSSSKLYPEESTHYLLLILRLKILHWCPSQYFSLRYMVWNRCTAALRMVRKNFATCRSKCKSSSTFRTWRKRRKQLNKLPLTQTSRPYPQCPKPRLAAGLRLVQVFECCGRGMW